MNVLGGGGHGGLWGWNPSPRKPKQQRKRRFDSKSQSSNSVEATGGAGHWFPLKQAATAGSLALTGDTIAQLTQRWTKAKALNQQDGKHALLSDHDWLRALRMTSYGFLLYGPGSYAWYQFLDHSLPAKTVGNLLLKVLLNQIVLGPTVIAVVFAWNNLWQRKLSQLPDKYRRDAFPTLLYGFKFWIPVSVLNFWVIPLQARVAFMLFYISKQTCEHEVNLQVRHLVHSRRK
ncbi:protein Mpv17 isoform X1 [Prunus yedoensis var. nudiflora]|uniref:Protein Mpv17 isoform X1 n=1 Tax=Prunus yedoensis var. nudiflora TaxID=2094558 RepID=A0A314UI38_PRUYE|nr:protein Mpv17 isoform X1 [Prunus yedoensis var. nudiflora]